MSGDGWEDAVILIDGNKRRVDRRNRVALLKGIEMPLEPGRVPEVVGIDRRDKAGPGLGDAPVAGARHAAIRLPNEANAVIGRRRPLNKGRRVVG